MKKRILFLMIALLTIAATLLVVVAAADSATVSKEESALSSEAVSVQARIDALPSLDDFYGMSREEQNHLYDRAQNLCDDYDALGAESEQINVEKLQALMEAYASGVQPVATDYGIYIAGEKVTGDKTSGNGWVYNPSNNSLTINGNISMTDAQIKSAPSPRSDYRTRTTTVNNESRFVPVIYVTSSGPLTLNVFVQGNVTVGRSGDDKNSWAKKGDALYVDGWLYRTCGIYAENKMISIYSAGSGTGTLNISTNDLGICCGTLLISGVNVNSETYNTSAIYATAQMTVTNGANVTGNTYCLGSLYGFGKNYNDVPTADGFVFRYDSLAAVFVGGRGDYEDGSLVVDKYSALHASGTAGFIRDDYNDYRSETALDGIEQIEYWDSSMWKIANSSDTRPYAGIWVFNGTMLVDQATTTVSVTSKSGLLQQFENIRNRANGSTINSHWNAFLFRLVGVYAKNVTLCASSLTIDLGSDGYYRSCGHDYRGIYYAQYQGAFENDGKQGNYWLDNQSGQKNGDGHFALYNASNLTVNVANWFYTDSGKTGSNYAINQVKLAENMYRAIPWSEKLEWDIKESKDSGSFCNLVKNGMNNSRHKSHNLAEIYFDRSETLEDTYTVRAQRRISAKDAHVDLHLRKNGDKYEACYKSNFPTNEITELDSNIVDLNQWTCANVHVFNDVFYLKARKDDNVTVSVGLGATAYYQMSGGTYYDSTLTFYANGDLHLEGDGILRELQLKVGSVNNLTGVFYMDSGTVASGSVNIVRVAMNGGHLHANGSLGNGGILALGYTTRDGKQAEGNYYCAKNVVKLDTSDSGGANALLCFDASGLSVMNPFGSDAYNTTGIYPIDGELWFWRPYEQTTYEYIERYDYEENKKYGDWVTKQIQVTQNNPYVFHHLVETSDEGYVSYAWPKVLEKKDAGQWYENYVLGLEWKEEKSELFEYHKNYTETWLNDETHYYVTEDTSTTLHSFYYSNYIEVPGGDMDPRSNPISAMGGTYCLVSERSYALKNTELRNNTYVVWELVIDGPFMQYTPYNQPIVLHYSDKSFEWTPDSFKWDEHEEQYCGRTATIPAFDYNKWKDLLACVKEEPGRTIQIEVYLMEITDNFTKKVLKQTSYNFHMLKFDETAKTEHYLDIGEEVAITTPYNEEEVATWSDESVTWYWEMAKKDGIFKKSDSKGSELNYKAFYDSATDNSYGYRFRRVLKITGGAQEQTLFYSPVHTIYLGAAIEPTSSDFAFQENDPCESLTLTFNAVRANNYKLMYRVRGDKSNAVNEVDGVTITTASGAEDGVTVVTATVPRANFQKANGYWDRDKLNLYEFFLRADSVLALESSGAVTVTPTDSDAVTISINEAPYFLIQPTDWIVIGDGSDETRTGFGYWVASVEDTDSAWWEYTTDGVTWVKVTTGDNTQPLYIERTYYSSGEWRGVVLNVPSTAVLTSGMRFRGVIQDDVGTVSSKEVVYEVVPLPETIGMPSGEIVWKLSEQTTDTLSFDFADELPEGMSVTVKWQYAGFRIILDGHNYVGETVWYDVENNDLYTVSDRTMFFADLSQTMIEKTYRCLLEITVGSGDMAKTYQQANEFSIFILRPVTFKQSKPSSTMGEQVWEGGYGTMSIEWSGSVAGDQEVHWEVSRDNGTTWENYTEGYISSISWLESFCTVSPFSREMSGWQFRCAVNNTKGGKSEMAYSGAYTLPRVRSEEVLAESEIPEALDHGNSVKLIADITLTDTWVIDKDTTLDLNGHYLTGGDFDLIKVTNNATLTIIDSNPRVRNEAADGTQLPFYGGSIRDASQRTVYVESGKVLFNGGTIYNCTYVGAIELAIETTLVVNGGKFNKCNYAIRGMYDNTRGATIEIKDGEILNCVYAVSAENATVTMSGGSISYCGSMTVNGGAFHLTNGQFTMSGGTIENCASFYSGAAIVMYGSAAVTITGGTISNCTANDNGGAIYHRGTSLTISGLTIEGCSADAGGAIYLVGGASVTISNSTISNCTATSNTFGGGAIYVDEGSITIGEKVVVEYCSAVKGGAIYLGENGDIRLTDTVIRGCAATDGSGAIWTKGSIYAEGGIADGGVTAGDIKKTDSLAAMTTSFYGKVSAGKIEAGLYYGEVTGINEEGFVTVTYKNNGVVYATGVVAVGGLALQPVTPEDTRTLIGWYMDKTPYQFNMPVNEDIVLVARWSVSDGTVEDMAEDLLTIENTLNEMKESLDGKADASVSNSITELSNEIDSLKSQLERLNSALNGKADQTTLESLSSTVSGIQNTITTIQNNLTTLQNADSGLQRQIDAINTALTDLNSSIGTLGGKITSLEGKVADLETAKTELNEAIDKKADAETVNAKIQELQEAIDALEAVKDDYATADTKLKAALEDQIEKAKTDAVSAATMLVENAKTELNKAIDKKADAAALAAAIENLNKSITTAQEAAQNYSDTQNDELKKALEKMISAAETTLNGLIDKVQGNLDKAVTELSDAISNGDADLSGKITALNTALEAAKVALEKADSDNLETLNQAISSAQTTLKEAIDEVQENLNDAKTELNAAITNGDKALDDKIKALNTALEAAQKALEATASADKTVLNNAISDAQAALQAAIDKVASDLADAKAALEAQNADLEAKLAAQDARLQAFTTITCVIASVSLAGNIAIAVMFILKRKRIG